MIKGKRERDGGREGGKDRGRDREKERESEARAWFCRMDGCNDINIHTVLQYIPGIP